MSSLEYEFFMQECNNKGEALNDAPERNLEKDPEFEGLRYSRIEGIEAKGSIKNTYSESYADADRLRVYSPKEVKHKETNVKLTLYFVGENRFKALEAFNKYISGGFHRYRDNARNKWFAFYIKEELKPADAMWYGTTPYLKMEYNLINIFGKTFDIENE